MKRNQSRLWISAAVAAAVVGSGFTATQAQASPARPIAIDEGAPSLIETARSKRTVRPRRGGNRAAAAAALGVLGLAAGAAIAASRDDYYYDSYPVYGGYGPGYYYGPRYHGGPRYYGQRRYYGPRQGYYRGPGPSHISPNQLGPGNPVHDGSGSGR